MFYCNEFFGRELSKIFHDGDSREIRRVIMLKHIDSMFVAARLCFITLVSSMHKGQRLIRILSLECLLAQI